MKLHFDARYALITAAALATVYWLSSIRGDDGVHDPSLLFVENVSHAPLFAALAFAWHRTMTKGQRASAFSIVLALLLASACAVLDEWHQSFVPGRDASSGDLAVDLAGIGTMLAFLHWRDRRASRSAAVLPTHS